MNRLIFMLIKEGLALFISRDLIRRHVRRIILSLIFYTILLLFAFVAIVFLYVFLDRWLSQSLGTTSAAAILCGGNLALIGLALIVRSLLRRRPLPQAGSIAARAAANPNFDAGIAIGRNLTTSLKKAAPEIAIAAAIAGVIFGIFRRRPTKKSD
jgi:hypothetical protein